MKEALKLYYFDGNQSEGRRAQIMHLKINILIVNLDIRRHCVRRPHRNFLPAAARLMRFFHRTINNILFISFDAWNLLINARQLYVWRSQQWSNDCTTRSKMGRHTHTHRIASIRGMLELNRWTRFAIHFEKMASNKTAWRAVESHICKLPHVLTIFFLCLCLYGCVCVSAWAYIPCTGMRDNLLFW